MMNGESRPADGRLVLGRYWLERELGRGAFGIVWLGVDATTQARVVVKERVSASARLAAVFEREARLLSRLTSEHVVRYLDYGVEGDSAYLVQEYVAGSESLGAWQSRRSLPELLHVYARVAGTLAELHATGIVHRDVKPENILVRAGEPVLVDFGLAVNVTEHDELTRKDSAVGTPAYMAPEAIATDTALRASADVFSLGVMLFEALTGDLPEGHVGSLSELLRTRSTGAGKWQSIRRIAKVPGFGAARLLLGSMLASKSEERPSARYCAQVLEELAGDPRLAGLSVPLEHGASRATLDSDAPPLDRSADTAAPASPAPPARGNFRLLAFALAMVVLAVTAVMLVWSTSTDGKSSRGALARALPVTAFALLTLVSAAVGATQVRRLRRSRAPSVEGELTPQAERRIRAIEAHVASADEFTRSLAVRIEDLVHDSVESAVRASLLVALKELKPVETVRASDTQRLIGLLEKLVVHPAPSHAAAKPLTERMQSYIAVVPSLVTAVGGVVGLGVALDWWRPQHAPQIMSFSATPSALAPGESALLAVLANDPDGDALEFEFSASEGTISAEGPSARLTAPRSPSKVAIAVVVSVTDNHHHPIQQTIAVPMLPPKAP